MSLNCPYCRAQICDDSRFCDQCGKKLSFCPECLKPVRGTECPACGSDAVDAEEYFASKETKKEEQLFLDGNGLHLPLQEGVFGRRDGIYPEFSKDIYVSGRHGELRRLNGVWQIRDLGSTNGTFLNDVRLQKDVWTNLKCEDKLKIATKLYIVQP
ncbi:MAG: FHA domain-containing protein [Alistipes sp.]|nr:FHA domain-containing protein [Candidatus Alistipes equi]